MTATGLEEAKRRGEGRLQGEAALVTGASSGIGQATARALAAEGASVAIGARLADRLKGLAEELRGSGATVATLDLDATDEQAAKAAVDRTVEALGRIDIVVNAAGLMLLGPRVDGNAEDRRRMMTTDVGGRRPRSRVVERSFDSVSSSSLSAGAATSSRPMSAGRADMLLRPRAGAW